MKLTKPNDPAQPEAPLVFIPTITHALTPQAVGAPAPRARRRARFGPYDFLEEGDVHVLSLHGPSQEWGYVHPPMRSQECLRPVDTLWLPLHPAVSASRADGLLLNDLAPCLALAAAGYRRGKRGKGRFDEDARQAWGVVAERLSRDDVLLPRKVWCVVDESWVEDLVELAVLQPWSREEDVDHAVNTLCDRAIIRIGIEEVVGSAYELCWRARAEIFDLSRRVRWGWPARRGQKRKALPEDCLIPSYFGAYRPSQDADVLMSWYERATREDDALVAAGLLPAEDPGKGLGIYEP